MKKYRMILAVLLALAILLMGCSPPVGYLGSTTAVQTSMTTTTTTTIATTTAATTTEATTTQTTTTPAAEPEAQAEPVWYSRNLWNAMEDMERDDAGHALTKFSEMAYVKPDLAAIDGRLNQLEKLVQQAEDDEAVFALYDQVVTDYGLAATQYTLVAIASDLNVNDTAASKDKVELEGKLNEYCDKLAHISVAILDSPTLGAAALERWGEEYAADCRYVVKLTREDIQPLNKKISALNDEYQQMLVNHTVDVDGEQLTLGELSQRGDLGLFYYQYLKEYYITLNEKAGKLFLEMVELRNEIAQKLGFENYAEYSYACYNRDYTPEDAAAMAEAVKAHLVPLHCELGQNPPSITQRAQSVSNTPDESLTVLRTVLPEISESMTQTLDVMLEQQLYDFSGDGEKMDGGYTTTITGYAVPFINYKSMENYDNFSTIAHEFGHFYNSYRFPEEAWNRTTDLDLAEIHSQGLELLLQEYYETIYGKHRAEAVEANNLINMVRVILSGCMEDEFQRRLYEEEDLTLEKLNALYEELVEEYQLYAGYYIPNSFWANTWVSIPHTFQAPFYYISYSTSLAAALEIWEIAQSDPEAAKALYLKVQSFSTYHPFLETLEACGMNSPFTETRISRLSLRLREHFDKLWQEDEAAGKGK